MDPTLSPLVTQLLGWIAASPRTHAETMDVWRTSCPRLPAWEEAVDQNLVSCPGSGAAPVRLTEAGRAWLEMHREGCVETAASL